MRSNFYAYLKRVIDIFASIFLIILCSPVLLLVSVFIRMDHEGSVIFRQTRLGRNSVPFQIYKFRTMRHDAPNIAAKDIDNDAYVTRIGRFLRKSSLDELPQLFNILKGEMSFVGPRPLIPNEGIINKKRRELSIDVLRPGLTGWAQVIARDTYDDQEKLELDLYYKKNISCLLDIKIILFTFTALKGK